MFKAMTCDCVLLRRRGGRNVCNLRRKLSTVPIYSDGSSDGIAQNRIAVIMYAYIKIICFINMKSDLWKFFQALIIYED